MERDQEGSLLFEVLIALMILSVGLVSVLKVFSQTLWVNEKTRQTSQATSYLNGVLFSVFSGENEARQTVELHLKADKMPLGENLRYQILKLGVLDAGERRLYDFETVVPAGAGAQ